MVEKRLEVLTRARLRDKSQIKHVILIQDELRSKSMGVRRKRDQKVAKLV